MFKTVSILNLMFCLTVAAMISQTTSLSTSSEGTSDRETEIRTLAQNYLASRPNTSLSIGITDHGKSQFYNFGAAPGKNSEPATSATVYEIGSITKTFAGVLLAQAITEHRAQPDDDVRKYLAGAYPNLEFGGAPIRLLHLANMTSGLPDNLPDLSTLKAADGKDADVWAKAKALSAYSKGDFLRDLHQVKLTEKPGQNPAHSNTAAQLLGYILEKIYDAPFEELVVRYIEKPLVMTADRTADRYAIGHDDQGNVMPALTLAIAGSAGGLRYSTADMVRYLEYQIGESSKAAVLTHTPNWRTLDGKLALGYFWIIHTDSKTDRRFRYSGGTFGCSSFCDFYPERKLGLVLLSNRSDRSAQDDLQKLSEGITAILHR